MNTAQRSLAGTGGQLLASAGFILCLSVLVFGWMLGLERFFRLQPDHAAMVPSTAICLLLVFSVVMLRHTRGIRATGFARAATLLVLIVSLSNLILPLLATPLPVGLDTPVMHKLLPSDQMAGATALCLAIGALAVLRMIRVRHDDDTIVLGVSLLGLAVISAVLLGHSFDRDSVYSIPAFSAMSNYTALALLLLFASMVLSQLEEPLRPE